MMSDQQMHETLSWQEFRQQVSAELAAILDWWMQHAPDNRAGGFIGRMDATGRIDPEAEKGIILNTRILWTFSAAARHTGRADYAAMADRAYEYLLDFFWDNEHGGFYWTLYPDGAAAQTKKQVYAQAFAIYALSEYYLLCRNEEALDTALETFALLEYYSLDRENDGYFEAFDREWAPLSDLRLSEKDANEAKTMNTHLHVLEGYANLWRASGQAAVRDALAGLVHLFLEKFIHPETGHLHLFFDENWTLKSHEISYGHDIECSWLLCEAAELLENNNLLERVETAAVRMATATLHEGLDIDGALVNEARAAGWTDTDKHWWPQAEAVVGFINAGEISGNPAFFAAAARNWLFIRQYIVDRELGEWVWRTNRAGLPDRSEDKISQWKCPYHNGRACLEVLRRE